MGDRLRVSFHGQLTVIESSISRLFAMVAEGMPVATDAVLSGDDEAVRTLQERDTLIDDIYAEVELLVNTAFALQAPVASDLRLLLSALRIVPELERSHDLIVHIARRGTGRTAGELTPRTRGLIAEMGALGAEMWHCSAEAFRARDPGAAFVLSELDEEMDKLHRVLVAELASGKVTLPMAMDMTLVARFYERLGDHAVNTSRRVAELAGDRAEDATA